MIPKLELFYNSLLVAQNLLQEKLDEINYINVFPVADNDTGTNLFITIQDNYLHIDRSSPIKKQVEAFSSLTFSKASGNSGFIFALICSEFVNCTKDLEDISPQSFGKTLLVAAQQSKLQIENYVDGSMVSFAEELANLLISSQHNSWGEPLIGYLQKSSKKALDNTKLKNPYLLGAGVVDAGALALYYWFFGLLSSLCGAKNYSATYYQPTKYDDSVCAGDSKTELPSYRYCIQATILIAEKDKHIKTIKQLLNKAGNCNLTMVRNNSLRFHIHSNNPQDIFAQVMDYSSVKDIKIDDMKLQNLAKGKQHQVAVVTDSSADIPVHIKEKYNIHVIPLTIVHGQQIMLDGLTTNSKSLPKLINASTGYPKTSSPSLGAIYQTFKMLSENYKHVIAVTLSSKMSGTYNAFLQVAKQFDNISVIDSKRNSGAQGFIVYEIAKRLDSGVSIQNTLADVDKIIVSKKIYVMVDNFSAMLRSGRVSKAKAFVAHMINFKPIVGIDDAGEGVLLSKCLSRRAQLEYLLKHLIEINKMKPIRGFHTLYVDNQEEAVALDKKISDILNIKSYGILNVSTVISLHGGSGALAIAIDQEV